MFSDNIISAMPDLSNRGDVILAACDNVYFENFGLALIQSIERLGIANSVHLHLLQPSAEVIEKVAELSRTLKFAMLSYTIDPCVLARQMKHPAIYWTAARFLLAPVLLEHNVKRLLIIDIDSVMKLDPWSLFSANTKSGAFIFRRTEVRPWRRILASAVLYNGTAPSKRLASALARSLAATFKSEPRYHIDQAIPHFLTSIARRVDATLHTTDIPAKIMGYEYESDAAFWTVKGTKEVAVNAFAAQRAKLLTTQDLDLP